MTNEEIFLKTPTLATQSTGKQGEQVAVPLITSTADKAEEQLAGISANMEQTKTDLQAQAEKTAIDKAQTEAKTAADALSKQKASEIKLKQDSIATATATLNKAQSYTPEEILSAGYTAQEAPNFDEQGNLIPKGGASTTTTATLNLQGNAENIDDYTARQNAAKDNPSFANEDSTSYNLRIARIVSDNKLNDLYTSISSTIQSQRNGTFPLTPSQQAQLTATQRAFESLIKEQRTYNKNYEGGVTMRMATAGLSQYAPDLAGRNIQDAVNSGKAKVADLENKMAQALSQMEEGFRTNNYRLALDGDKILAELQQKRSDEIQKQYDVVQNALKAQKEATDKAAKTYFEEVTKPIQSIAIDAAKNGASPDILAKINSSKTLQDAIVAAGDALQNATGIVAEYKFYEKQAKSLGQIPVDFNTYQNIDANRKAKVAAAGVSTPGGGSQITGLTKEQSDAVLSKGLTQIQAENVAGIYNGLRPPLSGFGVNSKEGMAVTAGLNALGYNLTKATEDWTAMTKRIATMNGTQQVRLQQAITFSYDSLDIIEQLNNEWKGGNFPILNKANLIAAKNGAYGQDAMSLATRLDAQINDLTSELGTVYKGGNSSTDESLKLAAGNLNSSWSQKTLQDAINLARVNLQIRKNSIANSSAIPGNIYDTNGTTSSLLQQGQENPLNLTAPAGINNPFGI